MEENVQLLAQRLCPAAAVGHVHRLHDRNLCGGSYGGRGGGSKGSGSGWCGGAAAEGWSGADWPCCWTVVSRGCRLLGLRRRIPRRRGLSGGSYGGRSKPRTLGLRASLPRRWAWTLRSRRRPSRRRGSWGTPGTWRRRRLEVELRERTFKCFNDLFFIYFQNKRLNVDYVI